MKKYIDYDSLEQEAYEMVCHARQQADLVIANTIKAIIGEQPDALVRCQDCKYWPGNGTETGVLPHWLPCKYIQREPYYYCADAKRRVEHV